MIMKYLKNVFKLFALLITFSLLVFTSCNKTDDTTNEIDLTTDSELKIATAIDQTIATDAFDEIIEITDEAIQNMDEILEGSQLKNGGNNGNHRGHAFRNRRHFDTITLQGRNLLRLSECATITREINEAKDSMLMVIDFGDENCLGPDDRERRGKIIITRYGNHYWDGAFDVSHTFENYFVNNNQVVGTKIVSGFINAEGLRVHHMIDNGSIILADAAGTITWSATRTRTVVEGSDTRRKFDDVVEVTGTSSGTDAEGNSFSCQIIEPIVRIHEMGCHRHPVSGIVQIVRSPDTEITIDYGDGSCDNLAEVTTNGVTEIIELGKNRKNN
jgi:hypothetical protein